MKCKLSRNRLLCAVCAFVTILTLLIAAAALAQQTGAAQPSGRPIAPPVSQQAGVLATSGRPGRGNPSYGPPTPNDNLPLFVPAVAYSSGSPADSITVADVNGDGKPDLLVATLSSVGVLLGNGDGTFQAVQSYSSPNTSGATSIAVADVNGDGNLDLVVSYSRLDNGSEGAVGVLLGNGNGTFQSARTYDSDGISATSVAVADVDGDGKLDLVVTNDCPINNGCNLEGSLSVLLGNGNGTFHPAQPYGSGGYFPVSILVADVNGDGKPDLVVDNILEIGGAQGAVAVLLGNGNGTFQAAQPSPSGGHNPEIYPASIAVGDLNGDGRPDLVVSSQCGDDNCDQGGVGVLLSNGNGTFRTVQTYSSGGYGARGVAVADVNGDGKLDLLVANYCSSLGNCQLGGQPTGDGAIGVLLGNGDGTFQAAQTYDSGGWGASGVAVGNVNGDGRIDLFASHYCGVTCIGGDGVVGSVLSNDGKPTTTTTLTSSADPTVQNQTVTYTATVQSPSGKPITGTVTFEDSWTPVTTVSLVASQATYSTAYSAAGLYPITVVYSGDANNAVSTSGTVVESITSARTKTTTKLASSGSPSRPGQPVTFTARVTWNYGTVPNGELVTFYDGTTAMGTGATASGVATFVTSSLTAKTHTIKAAYPGDGTFKPSSGAVKQVVEKYSTTTALSSSLNPSGYKQAVTFTATVTSGGPEPPTGKVAFKDGTTGLGTATLSGGVATLTKSNLAVGTHPITAYYLGDGAYNKSTSSGLDQVVQ